ncbi:hypothetical protein ACSBR2_010791 [Camellia fascicularis]
MFIVVWVFKSNRRAEAFKVTRGDVEREREREKYSLIMMSAAAPGVLAALHGPPTTGLLKPKPKVSATDRRSILWTEQKTRGGSEKGRLEKKAHAHAQQPSKGSEEVELGLSIQDYLERSKHMIRSDDGGPPRWFSPLEEDTTGSSPPLDDDCPLLLFLPGIDGVGLGLILHHQRLGLIFDIWCLHIPIMDRTTFTDLVKLVEGTVRSENNRSPNRPIYLVGESIGGCLALAVAAQNPDVDLTLILSNPDTCFKKSPLQLLTTYLEIMPEQLHLSAPYMLCLVTGFLSFIVMISTGFPLFIIMISTLALLFA